MTEKVLISALVTREPFSKLFPVEPHILEAIQENMRDCGYDKSKPIDIWDDGENYVVVDGNTRLQAARIVGITSVNVYYHKFRDEREALEYAIHNQRDRRNMTGGDILRCVRELDKRKEEGRPPKNTTSDEVVSGRTSKQTAITIGTSPTKIEKTRIILDHANPEVVEAVENNELTINKAYNQTQQERKAKQEISKPKAIPTFNETNENIEWARWTWNPVTGCKHGCSYCYARDIANRFYENGFEPKFHEDRLSAPQHTKPKPKIPGGTAVFVCSMADLFGEWVPNEWIYKVIKQVEDNPQWTFIFLTKNPQRLASVQFPDNAWVGTTVDRQSRAQHTEPIMRNVSAAVKFVSCEPMLEEIRFNDISVFDWVIIGGKSKTNNEPEFQPQWKWVYRLTKQAVEAGCKVYWKPNLKVRPMEYPKRG